VSDLSATSDVRLRQVLQHSPDEALRAAARAELTRRFEAPPATNSQRSESSPAACAPEAPEPTQQAPQKAVAGPHAPAREVRWRPIANLREIRRSQ